MAAVATLAGRPWRRPRHRRPRSRLPGAPSASSRASPPAGRHARTAARSTGSGCGTGFECADPAGPGRLPAARAARPSTSPSPGSPARDPKHRIGSLVVNYGGPGDPGTETLRVGRRSRSPGRPRPLRRRQLRPARHGRLEADRLRRRRDRRPRSCAEDPTPDTAADLPRFYAGTNSSVDVVKACIDRLGDLARRRSGPATSRATWSGSGSRSATPKLTYLGYSYGTVLGAVYAQDVPATACGRWCSTRAVDLSSTPEQEELGNAQGFEDALDAFLADCAARTSCVFHSGGDPESGARAPARPLRGRACSSVPRDGRRAGVERVLPRARRGALRQGRRAGRRSPRHCAPPSRATARCSS